VEDDFVQCVLRCIPKPAITRGVFPEDALKERFIDVCEAARKVALVGENGAPLPIYVLSGIMNMFMLRSERILNIESVDKPIDIDSLNTHDILDRAK
jgi:mitofilin